MTVTALNFTATVMSDVTKTFRPGKKDIRERYESAMRRTLKHRDRASPTAVFSRKESRRAAVTCKTAVFPSMTQISV